VLADCGSGTGEVIRYLGNYGPQRVRAAALLAPRPPVVPQSEADRGYTSGMLPLGTPPEKDIGYPYAASWGDASADVVAAMAGYSWHRHLIRHGAYSDWIDRGRMRPTHRQWSLYLREVAEAAEAEVARAVVTGLEAADGRRWQVRLATGDGIAADGVVITGAGPAVTVPGQPPDHPRVLDGRTYWLAAPELHHERAQSLCVIGSGETAASVVIDLVKRCHKRSTIDVLTARGVLYSRGESYDENRLYSDPADWPRLAEAHRREFLGRTDRGVFSLQAEATLNQARGFRTLAGLAQGPGFPNLSCLGLPSDLAERLAAEAGHRGISLSDLLAEYAEQGLRQSR
jgi:mycobactin lysine-N-oxygenase